MLIPKKIVVSLLIILCHGCGGSSDPNSGNSATDVNTNIHNQDTNVVEEENSSEVVYTASEDVIANVDFLFNSAATLHINVAIEPFMYRRAYINICHTDANEELLYDDCLLNAPLKRGQIISELTIANGVETLGMEIWVYSEGDEPLRFTWSRNDGLAWIVGT